MSKTEVDIDALLSKVEKTINPNLSKNVNKKLKDLDEGREEYIGDIEDTNIFAIYGEKVSTEEIEEALEVLTDPGYERETLRFYAQLVEYSKDLCEPILKRDQMSLNNIGMLNDPINMFIQRKMLTLLEKQITLLEEIKNNTNELKS